jgi:hypothetical protein
MIEEIHKKMLLFAHKSYGFRDKCPLDIYAVEAST